MFCRSAERLYVATKALQWKSSPGGDVGDKDKRNTHMDAHSMKDAAVFRKLADNDVKKVLDSLNNKKELQMLLADAYTPYDEVDPVFYSALLRDDLPTFLDRFNVTEEEFLSDYRQVRHLTTSTQELRASFQQKYGFNPYAVVFRESEFVLSDAELASHKVKILSPQPETSMVASEYLWWENQLSDMLQNGYNLGDYEEMRRWQKGPKTAQAVLLHLFSVLSIIFRIAVYTSRIDGATIQKFFYPRYLPTHAEVTEAFRLDIPKPENWKHTSTQDGVDLARRLDDFNKDFNGIYHSITFATFNSHFYDTHISSLPLKFFCKASFNLLVITKEYVDSLAEYLVSRAELYKATEVPIVEVGAGSGKLSYFLNASDAFKKAGLKCIATDLVPSTLPMMLHYPKSARDKVEPFECKQIDHNDAVSQYMPAIVICQMMPSYEDWPAEWRKHHNVLEYILIGPTDGPACGKPWGTWGQWSTGVQTSFVAPYVEEGFKRAYVDSVSRYLLGQDEHAQCAHQNRCVSFRRMTMVEKQLRVNLLYRSRPVLFFSFFAFLAYMTLPEE